MITIDGLYKSFGDQVLFEDLSFAVNRRERVGMVGRNGHGKTTLLRMILGEVAPDAGEIRMPRRFRIGHLDQHIHFTCDTVLEEAATGLPDNARDETWRAEKILSGLGFGEDDMGRSPHVFSGGYQVRLNLAKALLSGPDLLLLDEPTNYLDVVSIRWLARFLQSWPSELILVTHDRSFMDSVTTHTVAIHRHKAKKIEGGTDKLYAQILQEEEVYEKTRANDERRRKEIERFVERFRAKNTLATRVQSRIKFLEKHKPLAELEKIETLDFSFNASPFPAKVMLRVDDLAFAYDGGPELFSGLRFEIHKDDRICVIGQNGKGKSTLLRLLAAELEPRRGSVQPHPRLETGYFAQTNVTTLHPARTVLDEIQSSDASCLPQTARNIAGAMMFEGDAALKQISILSGGEKSRVMLGKLVVTPCNLLLLDEPTNHLDMDSCDSLLAAVDAFDGAVVMVTHNEMFLHSLATRFVVFDRGLVRLYDRSYQDFLDEVGWELDDLLRARPTRSTDGAGATAAGTPDVKLDKKALRQARAQVVRERARVVGPLEKRVRATEARIERLEREMEETTSALAEASVRGDPEAIADLSRRVSDMRPEIDTLYETLESATEAYERESRAFDARLDELSG